MYKRILSAILAVLMMASMNTPVIAEGQAPAGEEPVPAEVQETPAAEEESADEGEPEAPAEDQPEAPAEPGDEAGDAGESGDAAPADEEEPAVEPAAEEAEPAAEEAPAEEAPAQEITLVTPEPVTFNGVTVTVSYLSDAFDGKNVRLVVGEAGAAETAALDASGRVYKAVDVSFVDENGNPVQPAEGKTVSVALKADGMEAAGDYEVVHVDAEGNTTAVLANVETSNPVTEPVKTGVTTRTVEVPAETKTVIVEDYEEETYTDYETVEKTIEVPAEIGYRTVRKSREVEKTVISSGINRILWLIGLRPTPAKKKAVEYYYVEEPYEITPAHTETVTETVPVPKTRNVLVGTHEETKVIKEAYSYEVTEDVYEDITRNDVETSFSAASFSVYAIVAVEEDGSLDFDETFGADHITVKAPAGAFEAGTTMKIETVDDPEVLAKALKALDDNTYRIYGIDISFWKDGAEVEPKLPVKVTWTSSYIDAGDTLVHIKDDGTAEKVDNVLVKEDKTVFTTDSFSTYTTTRLDSIDLNADYGRAIQFHPDTITRPASMNSGELATTAPVIEGYTFKEATYQKNGHAEGTDKVVYLGAFIYREFDDQEQQIGDDKIWIYYRTTAAADNDLIVQLAENETIHLNYEATPFSVTYKVRYNGNEYTVGEDTLPAELADLVVNGPDLVAPDTTYDEAVRVTLPRGYSASVSMSNESGAQAPALGEGSEPNYRCTDGWTVVPNDYPFTIDGTYTIADVNDDLTVTIDVTKRTSYRFTAQPAFNTAYFGGPSAARYQQVNPNATFTFNGNSTEFSFITYNYNQIEWAMDSLNINKQSVLVPFVDNSNRTDSATTTLTSGTVVTVSAEYIASGAYAGNRRYTISVSNCYENISVTGGNLHNVNDKPEWVLQERENLSEFDYGSSSYLPLVAGEPMTYDGWQNYGNNAWRYWRNGTMVFTPRVIRFKVADGYVNPQIKYVTPEGTDDYRRVADVTLSAAAEDFYHLVTSEPDADGYYYFSLKGNSSSTYMGLLSARAELARYGVSYAAGDATGAVMPAFDEGGRYGDGTLQGYNVEDNTYVVLNKSAPTADGYIFLYYTIDGDTTDTHYSPSQKIPLEDVAQHGVYDESKGEFVIPFVAHWEKKEQSKNVDVIAHIFLDDVEKKVVHTTVPEHSSIYIDIDSETMMNVMTEYNWQLFYDETGSSPFVEDVTTANNEVTLRLYSKFYVYHSGTGKLELHTTKEMEEPTGELDEYGNPILRIGTLDLAAQADKNFLYGGYYMDYAGAHEGNNVSATNLVKAAADWDNNYGTLTTGNIQTLSQGGAVEIKKDGQGHDVTTIGTPYNPATTAEHVGYWNMANAFTSAKVTPPASWYSDRGPKDTAVLQTGGKGTEVQIARAGIYYIKEVPTSYLRNYHQITYIKSTGALTGLYLLSAIDDTNYRETGFTLLTPEGKIATVVKAFSVTNSGTGKTVTLKPTTVFKNVGLTGDGYLSYWNATGSEYYKQGMFTILPYWKTPDEIDVNGISTRTVTINSMTKSGIAKTDQQGGQ